MKKLNANFKFHPIGQGLFYSGKLISENKESFNFIYDCGTNSSKQFLDREINNFNGKKIDLLIISHLDKDHINGIPKLFKKVSEIDTVILPYLYPEERLLKLFNDIDDQSIQNDNGELIDFYINPIQYLTSKKVRNIKFIQPIIVEQETDIDLNRKEGDNNQSSNKENFFNIKNKQDKEFYEKIISHNEKDIFVTDEEWNKLNDNFKNNVVEGYKYYISAKYLNIWEFLLFNYDFDDKNKIKEFKANIKEKYFSIKNFIDEFRKCITRDEQNVFAAKYKEYFEDKNNTSIVTYHGPINPYDYTVSLITNFPDYIYSTNKCDYPQWIRNHRYCFNDCYSNKCMLARIGTMLFGDISLKNTTKNKNIFRQICMHYVNYVSKIGLLTMPHHGSKDNWNKDILKLVQGRNFWVSNAKSDNIKHPAECVIYDILDKKNIPLFNNELNAIEMNAEVWWD